MVLGGHITQKALAPEVSGFVMDLQRAGVRWEVGEEPAGWLKPEPVKVVAVATAPVPEVVEPAMPAVREAEVVRPKPVALAKVEPVVVTEVPKEVRVWREGEPGGVLVMVRGEGPLGGADAELLLAMLASVGLGEAVVGWVGVDLPEDVFAKGLEAKIGAEVAAMQPDHVLVLGSAVLGSWLGKNRGVEGWMSGSVPLPGLPEGVRAGVTYAPAMLRQKPLFKRLAWKHLVQWVVV